VEVALIPSKMKAVIFEEYGDPDVLHLAEVPVPTPRRGESLIKVHAVASTATI
jgi:NADPH2:quinone reductase